MVSEQRTLAENVEYWRKERGVSRVALSKRAGLGDSAVNDIVRNPERSAKIVTVEKIAGALDVGLADLLPGVTKTEDPQQIVPVELGDYAKVDERMRAILEMDEAGQIEYFRVATAYLQGFGLYQNDVLSIQRMDRYSSGDLIAAKVIEGSSPAEMVVSYLAEPVMVGMNRHGQPTHRYLPAPGITILGKVISSFRWMS